jgi:hypothetical protein
MFSSVGISQWIVVYPAGFSATMMFFTVPVSRYTVKLLFADLDIELIGFVAATIIRGMATDSPPCRSSPNEATSKQTPNSPSVSTSK